MTFHDKLGNSGGVHTPDKGVLSRLRDEVRGTGLFKAPPYQSGDKLRKLPAPVLEAAAGIAFSGAGAGWVWSASISPSILRALSKHDVALGLPSAIPPAYADYQTTEIVTNDTSMAGVAVRPPGRGSLLDRLNPPASALRSSGPTTCDHREIRSNPRPQNLLRLFSLLMLCLCPAGCRAEVVELRTQRELSDVAGVFTASRYLVYTRSDDRYLYFKERGKFGPLGPSREFKISSKVFAPHSPEPDSVLTYDQNNGVFCLRGKKGEDVIKTDFTEKHTREEEQYLSAVSAVTAFAANDESLKKREALLKVMLRSFRARHPEEANGYARELLLMEHRNPMLDEGSNRVHVAHTLMGLIALERNNLAAAKESLLLSAKEAPGTATIGSFGPNMRLAQGLLARNEKQTVIEYLKLCERFWSKDTLKIWQQEIERGQVPDFSANLSYNL